VFILFYVTYSHCYSVCARPHTFSTLSNLPDLTSRRPTTRRPSLGPSLFSITIQTLLDSLISELTLGYLDDLTVGDNQTKMKLLQTCSGSTSEQVLSRSSVECGRRTGALVVTSCFPRRRRTRHQRVVQPFLTGN